MLELPQERKHLRCKRPLMTSVEKLVQLSKSEVRRRFVRQICPPQRKGFVALSLLKDRHSKPF